MLQGFERTVRQARQLRASMTFPEVMLWRALRVRPDGLKFRRQQPAGPYVADFYCHEARLIIEVDGVSHDFGNRPERDQLRDAWFEARGLFVLRLAATLIMTDLDAATRAILDTAESRIARNAREE